MPRCRLCISRYFPKYGYNSNARVGDIILKPSVGSLARPSNNAYVIIHSSSPHGVQLFNKPVDALEALIL